MAFSTGENSQCRVLVFLSGSAKGSAVRGFRCFGGDHFGDLRRSMAS